MQYWEGVVSFLEVRRTRGLLRVSDSASSVATFLFVPGARSHQAWLGLAVTTGVLCPGQDHANVSDRGGHYGQYGEMLSDLKKTHQSFVVTPIPVEMHEAGDRDGKDPGNDRRRTDDFDGEPTGNRSKTLHGEVWHSGSLCHQTVDPRKHRDPRANHTKTPFRNRALGRWIRYPIDGVEKGFISSHNVIVLSKESFRLESQPVPIQSRIEPKQGG